MWTSRSNMSYIRFLSSLCNPSASTPQMASHILHCNNCGFGQLPVSWCIPTECVTRLLRYACLSLLLQHVFAIMSLALLLCACICWDVLLTVEVFGNVVKEAGCWKAMCFCSGLFAQANLTKRSIMCKTSTLVSVAWQSLGIQLKAG